MTHLAPTWSAVLDGKEEKFYENGGTDWAFSHNSECAARSASIDDKHSLAVVDGQEGKQSNHRRYRRVRVQS